MAASRLGGVLVILTLMLAACGGADDEPTTVPAAATGRPIGNLATQTAFAARSGSATSQGSVPATATVGDPRSTAPAAGTLQPTATPDIQRTPQPTSTVTPTRTPQPTTTPRPTNTATSVPPTSTPEPVPQVEIISQNIVRIEGGVVLFFGEVENTGAWPATAVQVQVELLTSTGQRVGRGEGYADGYTIMPPGTRLGYVARVTLDDPAVTEWASENITISFQHPDAELVALYTSNLTVNVEGFRPPATPFDFVELAGTVVNSSGGPLTFAKVTVTAFDGAGAVISVDSYIHNEPIAQDAGFPFVVEFTQGELSADPASYTLVVEGLMPEA